ncbi:MAG: type II toxin-antitoxin system RelE/ParE family toxin [Myxococcota bacterium]
MDRHPREFRWVASALKDLSSLPWKVKRVMGYALRLAQQGDKHPDAKPLKGFGGGSVLEIVEDNDGDTYRAIYTVRFADAVYLLHAFQKKSKRGAKTPAEDIELVKRRLKVAEADDERRQKEKSDEKA